MNDIFHLPLREVGDDPARVAPPDDPEMSETERAELIQDRADMIYQDLKCMIGSFGVTGERIVVCRINWDPADVFEDIYKEMDPDDAGPVLSGDKAVLDRLMLKWSEDRAREEVDNGEYP